MYVLVAATASSGPAPRSIVGLGRGRQGRGRVVRDGERRGALAAAAAMTADDVRRRARLADADDERPVEPRLRAVERDDRRRPEPDRQRGAGPRARTGRRSRRGRVVPRAAMTTWSMARSARSDGRRSASTAPACGGGTGRRPRAVRGSRRGGVIARLLPVATRDREAARRTAAISPAERGAPAPRASGQDRVGRERRDAGRVGRDVPRRPRGRPRRSACPVAAIASTSADLGGLAMRRRSCRRRRGRAPRRALADGRRSRRRVGRAGDDDLVDRREWWCRSAAASPGATVDDVSAGVRSVGSGMIARIRAPGARRRQRQQPVRDRGRA